MLKSMILRKMTYFFLLMVLVNCSIANAAISLDQIDGFLGEKIIVFDVNRAQLPRPYDFLLTQHLMTLGVEHYYQRTPEIRAIHVSKKAKENTYSRVITMVVDRDKLRNNVKIAQAKNETLVVELAFITMNFNALPEKIIRAVLNTKIPFGKLLAKNKIETLNTDRHYFSVQCNETLAKYIPCDNHTLLYGRTNTILRKKDKKWLAEVVEILSGVKCKDPHCQRI